LADYPHLGAENRDTYYFRGVFLRILRALDYVKSRPEWDGKTLIVAGGSQGGGLALIAAGLDPAVSTCLAGMPALCDHLGYTRNQFSGWPQLVAPDSKNRKSVNPNAAKTSGYYDVVCFAPRIKAQTEVSIGLRDTTCPPTSVFAAFNSLATPKKTLWIYPEAGHSLQGRKVELKPGIP
jgi:cephalosporin-C deacetylase-like acetyl esterase